MFSRMFFYQNSQISNTTGQDFHPIKRLNVDINQHSSTFQSIPYTVTASDDGQNTQYIMGKS